jgi:adenosylcobinamide kinase/adenosylcobinamide-phosphate guanylyltransferase
MGKLIFLTGGARSGKSAFAVQRARACGKRIAYIATGTAGDDEMACRISKHRQSRPKSWETIEEPLDVSSAIKRTNGKADVVIVDCLTLLVTNLLMKSKDESSILTTIQEIVGSIRESNLTVLVVSNETGAGIVPDNRLARDFRDIAGRANQLMAGASDEAYLLVAGLPLKLK